MFNECELGEFKCTGRSLSVIMVWVGPQVNGGVALRLSNEESVTLGSGAPPIPETVPLP